MKVIVDDLIIEYADEGTGPTLLFLHGWGNTMQYFDSLCAELPEFRRVRVDAPGFGGSQVPSEPWDVSRYTQFVAQFCTKLELDPAAIIGHSFGGRIATKGVGTRVLSPKKIVLIASAGVANRRTMRTTAYAFAAKLGKIILAPMPRGLYEHFRSRLYRATGSDYLTIREMKETFLNMIREDLSEYARAISTPTLLIWGARDEVTPLSEGERLHALIARSRLEVIPGAGHFVYREHPATVAKLIREFI